MKVLFPSREGHFSFRWIRKILVIRIRRRACVSLRRGISGSYIDDQSLMPRYGSRALGGKGREGQNLSTFVWVLIHPWRWLAWASVIEKPPFCESYCRAAERLPPPIERHLSVGTLRRRVLCPSECLRYIIYIGRADAKAWPCPPASETITNGL